MLSIVPDDIGVLQKLGDIYENINDKQQAYHYYYEVYNNYCYFYLLDLLKIFLVIQTLSLQPRSVGLVRSILC